MRLNFASRISYTLALRLLLLLGLALIIAIHSLLSIVFLFECPLVLPARALFDIHNATRCF